MMWDESIFDIFHNTTAEIAVKGDYDDYENTYSITEKGKITGDLQPYSGELTGKEHGLITECKCIFYCHRDDGIKEGVYLLIGGASYEVIGVERWNMGCKVYLKEAELNGRRK